MEGLYQQNQEMIRLMQEQTTQVHEVLTRLAEGGGGRREGGGGKKFDLGFRGKSFEMSEKFKGGEAEWNT